MATGGITPHHGDNYPPPGETWEEGFVFKIFKIDSTIMLDWNVNHKNFCVRTCTILFWESGNKRLTHGKQGYNEPINQRKGNTMQVITLKEGKVNISDENREVLDLLDSCAGGRFATVHKLQSGLTNKACLKPEVVTINFFSKCNPHRRNAKLHRAIESIAMADCDLSHPKLVALSESDKVDLFNTAKTVVAESYRKTEDGDRSDGYRQGHDSCYMHSSTGIKVHLVTEDTKVDGRKVKRPVIADNGLPTVDCVMVMVQERSRTVHVKGEWKSVNSQAKTIMRNAIEKATEAKAKVHPIKSLSLRPESFESLTIDKEVITPEDLESFDAVEDAQTAEV